MKFTRAIPRSQRLPAYAGRLVVDTVRGVMRVRKWPRKRGTPTSAAQLFWIDWFRQANLLAKYADAASMRAAIELTKGSRWYPRDILLMAMRGRLLWLTDTTGWKWYPMAAIQDLSDSLDILSQTVGKLLVRATDRWRAAVEGSPGDVLTQGPAGQPPSFQPSAGAGGVVQQDVVGTPIVPDGTKSFYELDVTAYAILDITCDNVGFAATARPELLLSTDGGVTFKNAATDYQFMWSSNTSQADGLRADLLMGVSDGTTGSRVNLRLTGLQTPRASSQGLTAGGAHGATNVAGSTQFAGPITDIRIQANTGANFNAGVIRVVGTVKG